jgi:hypothetical protein
VLTVKVFMSLNIESQGESESLPKGLKNISKELNTAASNALVSYFITEVTPEDEPPLEAQMLSRWAMTPSYFREDDEKNIADLSNKLKVDKLDLYACMRSGRYRAQAQVLLSDGGHDQMLMQLIEDVIISKALGGDMPAINTLLKMTGRSQPKDKQAVDTKALASMTDAELLRML